MRGGFTKGIIIGSVLGASVGMMMDDNGVRRTRHRMARNGRRAARASTGLIDNFTEIFR